MRRRKTGRFAARETAGEDINPMESVANLVDVMLVFACGLMLALITYWNVDVAASASTAPETVRQGQEIADASGLNGDGESPDGEGTLEEYGRVFIDPATGKLYMVTD